MRIARQLALPLPFQDPYGTADFLAAPSNEAALTWLERMEAWPSGRLALAGAAGCGKTHLLHVWARRVGATVLHGTSLRAPGGLTAAGALAIDDADLAADEHALLHSLNQATEARSPVLLAGRAPSSRWPVRLPDLRSRLRATTPVEIGLPDEDLLCALLARLFAERQLAVAPEVQHWMLTQLPRTGGALRDAVARLDHAALRHGCRITRPFVAAVLEDRLGNDPNEDDVFESHAAAGSSGATGLL